MAQSPGRDPSITETAESLEGTAETQPGSFPASCSATAVVLAVATAIQYRLYAQDFGAYPLQPLAMFITDRCFCASSSICILTSCSSCAAQTGYWCLVHKRLTLWQYRLNIQTLLATCFVV